MKRKQLNVKLYINRKTGLAMRYEKTPCPRCKFLIDIEEQEAACCPRCDLDFFMVEEVIYE